MEPIRIAFFGTPELCLPYLKRLQEKGMAPCLVVTAPDRPVGRKQTITPPPVKTWADNAGIPTLQPETLSSAVITQITEHQPDISIVVAYGRILPNTLIHAPTHGTINVHYSLLPRWRGASPVEATILAGDTQTGVCIQNMVYQLDAGDVISQASLELHGDETAPELREILTEIGAELLVDTLPQWMNDAITPQPQDASQVTTCTKIKRADGEVSLDMPAEELWRKYRAYHGWPGIFFTHTPELENSHGTGQVSPKKRVKITDATYNKEENIFTPTHVIPEGKQEMGWEEYLKNNP